MITRHHLQGGGGVVEVNPAALIKCCSSIFSAHSSIICILIIIVVNLGPAVFNFILNYEIKHRNSDRMPIFTSKTPSMVYLVF